MSGTINGTYTSGVTLAVNPTTIASTANVDNTAAAGAAIYGPSGTTWTLTNLGSVAETGTGVGIGISFAAGGTIINAGSIGGNTAQYIGGIGVYFTTGGSVSGYFAVKVQNDLATVVNAGSIAGKSTAGQYVGVYLGAGGLISNQASGTISGYFAIDTLNDAATVVNAGAISGNDIGNATKGIYLHAGGSVTNQSSGTISRLIVDPGAVFIGAVSAAGTTTLELASGSSAGMISGLGTSIVNFASLAFDSGAHWTVAGTGSASGLGTLGISGFAAGDTIDLSGFVAVSQTFASNMLTLANAASQYATLNIQGAFTTGEFQLFSYAGGTGTSIVLCFAEGTHIATSSGARPVEDLMVGEMVQAQFAGPTPIQWIGRRHLDCTRHPEPRNVWPDAAAQYRAAVGSPWVRPAPRPRPQA